MGPRLFVVPGFTNYCQGFKASEVPGGKVLERIPVALEAVAKQGVLDENNGGVADGALVPLAPGTVRITVRTMCPGPKVATGFSLQVR